MEEAKSSATELLQESEDSSPGLLEWGILGAGAAPWLWLAGVLVSARDPSTTRLGFSGYVSNPTAGRPFAGTLVPDVTLDPVQLSVPPIPGPRSTLISGQGFVPYEYVALLDDSGAQFDTVQADVNGRFGYTYSPSPIVEGWHTVTVVDLDYGVRVPQKWFGYFPPTLRT